jgi:phosphatidylglycerol:prolipoprotein diacylglycerol transferase
MYWTCLCALGGGLLGAHLLGLYVYRDCCDETQSWWRIWTGGKSYYGGLLGGAAAAMLYLRLCGKPLLRYANAMAPAVALGYGVGRLGCFLNGCDFGIRMHGPFTVRYGINTEAFHAHVNADLLGPLAQQSLAVLPVQLLHAFLGVLLLVILLVLPSKWRVSMFAIGYGAGRFALEFLRGDFENMLGPMSLQQLFSLALFASGALVFVKIATAQWRVPRTVSQ